MKNKTLEKLRAKAIHALGGVMPCGAFDKPLGVVNEYTKYPVRYRGEFFLRTASREEEKQYAIQQMAMKFADMMVQQGYYTLTTNDEPYGTRYEMTIEIIPLKCGDAPRENMMNFQ